MGRRWVRRSDYSRRDTRQSTKRRGSAPIGGGRESPLTHPAPRCRHDSSRTRGSSQPPPAAVLPRGRAVLPRRRIGANAQPIAVASTAIGVPGRIYIDLENALDTAATAPGDPRTSEQSPGRARCCAGSAACQARGGDTHGTASPTRRTCPRDETVRPGCSGRCSGSG